MWFRLGGHDIGIEAEIENAEINGGVPQRTELRTSRRSGVETATPTERPRNFFEKSRQIAIGFAENGRRRRRYVAAIVYNCFCGAGTPRRDVTPSDGASYATKNPTGKIRRRNGFRVFHLVSFGDVLSVARMILHGGPRGGTRGGRRAGSRPC